MPLGEHQFIDHYEILAIIGAGGMGEVYRARDSRLNRDVAIKVLPGFSTSEPERLHRFEQERREAAAALKTTRTSLRCTRWAFLKAHRTLVSGTARRREPARAIEARCTCRCGR